jgi:hypothetical protein
MNSTRTLSPSEAIIWVRILEIFLMVLADEAELKKKMESVAAQGKAKK